jgi:hypothetical protein
MMLLRIWFANRLLDLGHAVCALAWGVLPADTRAKRERLRRLR